MKIECLYPARAELAEGPVWHEGALWWVDIVAGTLNRLDVRTGINSARATGDFLGAAVPDDAGGWILVRRHHLSRLHWTSGEMTDWTEPAIKPGLRHRLNDAKCGPDGRLWAGTLSLDGAREECALYCFTGRRAGQAMVTNVSLSNGLAWSNDGSRLYHVDTLAGNIQCWRYDAEFGTLHDHVVFAHIDPRDGYPDGMTIDVEGHLWVAMWAGGGVVHLDGRSGKMLSRYSFPISNPSSCAFGGTNGSTLYVTSAWQGMSSALREAEPLAGSIFAMDTDTRGTAVHLFQREKC